MAEPPPVFHKEDVQPPPPAFNPEDLTVKTIANTGKQHSKELVEHSDGRKSPSTPTGGAYGTVSTPSRSAPLRRGSVSVHKGHKEIKLEAVTDDVVGSRARAPPRLPRPAFRIQPRPAFRADGHESA